VPQLLLNSSASGASSPAQWGGGAGVFEVSASSFGGATVTLQARNLDGTFSNVSGTALTANGRMLFALPPGQIRVNSTAAPTGLNVAAWRNRKAKLAAILAGSGGGAATFPTFTGTLRIAQAGDSLHAFSNHGTALVSLANTAIARAADGSVTVTIANQEYGLNTVYLNNMASDLDFERAGQNTFAAGSFSIAASTMLPTSAAAVASPPGLTQPAANPATTTNGRITSWDRFDTRGTWWSMQGALKGGLELVGNFGHGGALVPFTSQITYMMTFAPMLVDYRGGINNAKGAQSAATIWAGIKADLDQISGLDGNVGVNHAPCMVRNVSPVGTVYGAGYGALNKNVIGEWNPAATGYQVGTLNDLIYKYCQQNPTKFLFIDEWTNAIDKVTDPNNWRMFDSTSTGFLNMTPDGTHHYPTLTRLNGRTAAAAIAPYYTPIDYLPRKSTDTFSVNGHARLTGGPRGPWFGSGTTAVGNTGGSGTVPTGWGAGRTTGSTSTVACSIVDPGDSKRLQVQAVITFGAANEEITVWPHSSGGVTHASLGLTPGTDSVDGAFALTYSSGGAVLGRVQMAIPYTVNANNYASVGETIETVSGAYPDAMTAEVFRTGWCKIATGQTQFTPGIMFRSVAAGTVTVLIECVDFKKK
jgi:hypothetical protein